MRRERKYIPYNFDEKYEYRVYSRIGRKYIKEFKSKKTRKRIVKYPEFDKYLEWENYFKDKFIKNNDNDCNFLHYLNRKFRTNKVKLELCKTVVVPVYVGEFTGLMAIYQSDKIIIPIDQQIIMLFSAIILTLIFCFWFICYFNNKVSFYNDCIDIIKAVGINHQK